MKNILFLIIALGFLTITACDEESDVIKNCYEDADFTDYQINFDEIIGFDDFGSPGAALVAAIDSKNEAALIVALKFDLPLYNKTFSPNCNPISTALDYNWVQSNSITEQITQDYPYLESILTNTSGIRTMNQEIAAFFVIEATELTPQKFFIAVKGDVKLTRQDGPSDILEGKLSFVEMTESSINAEVNDNALYYTIDDIYIEWNTSTQPD